MLNLPDFVRRTTPSVLNEYCTTQKLGINIKADGEADKNIASFVKSFEALDAEVQKIVQADFEEIGELANEKGSQMLIQKMQEANVTTPKGFEDQSAHDRAIWAYLHQQNAFRSVATHFEVENVEGWVTFRTPYIDKETTVTKKDLLAKAIAGYFHSKEWRGTLCEVDVVEKDGYICLVCHPQDYAHKEPIFGNDGKLNRSAVYQGTLKVFFLCRPNDGQLKIKARGKLPKKIELATTFAQTIYGKDLSATDVVKYDLSPLQDPSFTFRPLPEVGVLGADVMSLRISHKALKSSVQITAWDKEGEGVENMRWRLERMNLKLNDPNIEIDQLKIKVVLDFENEKLAAQRYKYRKSTVIVTITKPATCAMKENDLAEPIQSALRLWKLCNEE